MRLKNKIRFDDDDDEFYDDDYPVVTYFQPVHQIYGEDQKTAEVIVLQDIYKPGEGEEYVLLKKGCQTKRTIFLDDIVSINQMLTDKGRVHRSKAEINLRGQDSIIVKGEYNTLKKQLLPKPRTPIGFKFY